MKQTKVIGFFNQKGGVGKSTSCNTIACYLQVIEEKKICAVDVDAQQSILKERILDYFFYKYQFNEFKQKKDEPINKYPFIKNLIKYYPTESNTEKKTPYDIIGLINEDISTINNVEDVNCDLDLIGSKVIKVKEIIEEGIYDYILIDFPGTLNQIGIVDFLELCDYILIPVKGVDQKTIESTDQTIRELKEITDLKFSVNDKRIGVFFSSLPARTNEKSYINTFDNFLKKYNYLYIFDNHIKERAAYGKSSEGIITYNSTFFPVNEVDVSDFVNELQNNFLI